MFIVSGSTGTAETVGKLYLGLVPSLGRLLLVVLFFVLESLALYYLARKHSLAIMGASTAAFLLLSLLARFSMFFSLMAAPAVFLLAPFYLLMLDGFDFAGCLKELHLAKRNLLKNIGVGIAGAVVTGLAVLALMLILSVIGLADQHAVRERIADLPWYAILIAVTIAPIAEELFFRAYLSDRIGIILSSLLFAAGHFMYGSVAEIVAAFSIGVLLCYIMRFDRSTIAPIVTHVIFNVVSLSLMFLV